MMRLPCPSCNAEYDVPDALIGNGRWLRCVRCVHDWLVQPPTDPDAATAAAPPDSAAPQRLQVVPPQPLNQQILPALAVLWLAWITSVTAVALGLAGLWLFRSPLGTAWPPLQRLYALLA